MPRRDTRAIARALRRIAVGSLAVVALAATVGMPGGGRDARLSATGTGGTLTLSNSLAGQAILRASDMAPGSSASGTVRIGNAGTLAGMLSLSQSSLIDTPGPGGGPLSERLALLIEDLVTGETVYAGALADTGTRPLGSFPAGDARDYRFTLTFPSGADDNAYQASTVSVRYDWSASAPGSTEPADPNSLVAPRRRLGLRVRAGSLREIVRDRRFALRVRCRVPCRSRARTSFELGRRRLALPEVRSRGATRSARLTVRLSRAAAARVWRAVSRGRPTTLHLRVDVRAAGRRSAANIQAIRLTRRSPATASGLTEPIQVPIPGP